MVDLEIYEKLDKIREMKRERVERYSDLKAKIQEFEKLSDEEIRQLNDKVLRAEAEGKERKKEMEELRSYVLELAEVVSVLVSKNR